MPATATTATVIAAPPAPAQQRQPLRALTQDQVDFYLKHGYLRIPQVFTEPEMAAMDRDLTFLMGSWAQDSVGWTGPWRKVYMDETTESKSRLVSMHDLQLYSQPWNAAVNHPRLCDAMADLLGPDVELHHSTLHAKPPETGHPFPMHQDWAFYGHEDNRYIDVLVHLDDTNAENGQIRFLDGSHALGGLEHVTKMANGEGCTPHLPTDKWHLEDTVPVPAKRGDCVIFNIFTIHGSYINRTDRIRRMVRIGYRDPRNKQLYGQAHGVLGQMVRGRRPQVAASLARFVEE